MIPFQEIRRASAARSEELCHAWLPDGRRQGQRWVARNPTRRDRRAGSFSVDLRRAIWRDFATGDGGGDLISLYAYVNNTGQAEAARRLAEALGVPVPTTVRSPARRRELAQESARWRQDTARAKFWRFGRLAGLEYAKVSAAEASEISLLAATSSEAWRLQSAHGADLIDLWHAARATDRAYVDACEAWGIDSVEHAKTVTALAIDILAEAELTISGDGSVLEAEAAA